MEHKDLGKYQGLIRYSGSLALASLVSIGTVLADESGSSTERFYQLLDETRLNHDLSPLQRSITLERIAQHRANQIVTSGAFTHYDESGNLVISSLIELYGESTSFNHGEILGLVRATNQGPEFLMAAFEESCTHRVLLLWRGAEKVGIATEIASDGTLFIVSVFASNVNNPLPTACS